MENPLEIINPKTLAFSPAIRSISTSKPSEPTVTT